MSSKISILNLDDLLHRYIAGESENRLSREAGVSRSAFRNKIIGAGIIPRNQSQSETIKWARMTAEQRARQVKAAHIACTGRDVSFEELCLRARMREGSLTYNVSEEEKILAGWLRDKGLNVIHNFAVGPYNCDIGTGSITVEVWGGSWHPKPIDTKRTKYILDSGYGVLIIDVDRKRFPLTSAVTQYVISLLQETGGHPTDRCQYWMVRGDGELIFKRFNGDDISLIPPFTSGRNATNGQYKRIPR